MTIDTSDLELLFHVFRFALFLDQAAAALQVLAMAQQPLMEKRVDPWHQPILQHRLATMRMSATAAAAISAPATAAAAPSSHPSSAARAVSGPAQMVAALGTGPVQGQCRGIAVLWTRLSCVL